jgi:GT2 family glycosyltransferase
VIRLGRNTGFAHAVNRGVAECRTDHLAILNSDVELDPAWLAELLASKAPFACGKILSATNAAVLDGAYDLICRGGCPWRVGNGTHSKGPSASSIDCSSFTAVLFERTAFLSVGSLDETFESYLEDVDFGFRCMARSIHGKYVPAAICRHHGSASLGKWNPSSVRRMARNQVFLIRKHYPIALIRRWWWPILVAHGLWGLLALRHGAGLGWLRGKWQGLRKFHKLPQTPNLRLETCLLSQEAAIHTMQERQGMDWYWRAYFGLTGYKRHRLKG